MTNVTPLGLSRALPFVSEQHSRSVFVPVGRFLKSILLRARNAGAISLDPGTGHASREMNESLLHPFVGIDWQRRARFDWRVRYPSTCFRRVVNGIDVHLHRQSAQENTDVQSAAPKISVSTSLPSPRLWVVRVKNACVACAETPKPSSNPLGSEMCTLRASMCWVLF